GAIPRHRWAATAHYPDDPLGCSPGRSASLGRELRRQTSQPLPDQQLRIG
ncbi:MAG: hypothetical protein AVDCRST_MAG59-561, partial [uncultured Thermomicrobiales bacterium]